MVGGLARVVQDVPPFMLVDGLSGCIVGLNLVGLRRNGFTTEQVAELKRAYRLFFKSEDLNIAQARARAETELKQIPEVQDFLRFFERSERGAVI